MSDKVTVKSLEETQKFALDFAKQVKIGDILCLYGNLGSGKTTFVQTLAKGLGIEKRIISPTFILVRQYVTTEFNFYHIDLYRAVSEKDLWVMGLGEILKDEHSIVAIEWAEKLGSLLPEKRIDIRFSYVDEATREIEIVRHE